MVNRGWVPFTPGPANHGPALNRRSAIVSVVGLVRETVTPEGLQTADPATGVLPALARPDLARLEAQLDYDILPVYLQLEAQEPAGLELPFRRTEARARRGPPSCLRCAVVRVRHHRVGRLPPGASQGGTGGGGRQATQRHTRRLPLRPRSLFTAAAGEAAGRVLSG